MTRRGSHLEFLNRSWGSPKDLGPKADETYVFKTLRGGFPCHPSCVAYDPVQRLLAVGTRSGSLCVFGQPGVERFCEHETEAQVLRLHFLINEGALVSVCSDEKLHMWSLRQNNPVLIHSLTLEVKGGITSSHLPFRSKWLYVGTTRGNVHIIILEGFTQSHYSVMWNDAVGSSHPGDVIHISENPLDEDKLLIGYETGRIVLWDIKSRKPLHRYKSGQVLHSMVWQSDGEVALCGFEDGTVGTWSPRDPGKHSVLPMPHDAESRGPVMKIDHRSCVSGDPLVVVTGSSAEESGGSARSIFVVRGNSVSVTDTASDIADFVTLSDSPFPGDSQNPFAVAVLLEEELVMIDLKKESCPVMDSPAALRLHQAEVTCCLYRWPCSSDLLVALSGVSSTRARERSVRKKWPVRGGIPSLGTPDFVEVILTGHSDGTVKIWDGSGGPLLLLTEVDAGAVLQPSSPSSPSEPSGGSPLAVLSVSLCRRSQALCVALACAHVLVYRLCERETRADIAVVDIGGPPRNDSFDVAMASDLLSPQWTVSPRGRASPGSGPGDLPCFPANGPSVRSGAVCQPAGYQAEAVVRVVRGNGASGAPSVSSVCLCYEHGLVAVGHSYRVTVVDFKQKSVLASFSMSAVLGGTDNPSKTNRDISAETDGSLEEDNAKSSPVNNPRRLSLMDKVLKSRRPSEQRSPKVCVTSPEGPLAERLSSPLEDPDGLSVRELCFGEPGAVAAKPGASALPGCVWAATSRGTVASLPLRAMRAERRGSQAVLHLGQNRKVTNLGGAVLFLGLLDRDGCLPDRVAPPCVAVPPRRSESVGSFLEVVAAAAAAAPEAGALVVACAERQLCVWGARTTHKRQLGDAETAVRAGAVDHAGEMRLACLRVDGAVAVFELPTLALLLCASLVPTLSLRVAHTACFADGASLLYMSSAGEFRRAALAKRAEGGADTQADYRGDLFIPVPYPEATNKQFFKKLFKSLKLSQDKSELFGETVSGNHHHHHDHHSAPRPAGQAQHPAVTNGRSQNSDREPGAGGLLGGEESAFQRALRGIADCGEFLQDAMDKTEEMRNSAYSLLKTSQQDYRGDLFIPVPYPEATNKQSFKKLLKSLNLSQDKSELFGETVSDHHHHDHHSAPRPAGQAQHPAVTNGRSQNSDREPGAGGLLGGEESAFQRALRGIADRGEFLQDAMDKTEEMRNSAYSLLKTSQQIAMKHEGRRYSHK